MNGGGRRRRSGGGSESLCAEVVKSLNGGGILVVVEGHCGEEAFVQTHSFLSPTLEIKDSEAEAEVAMQICSSYPSHSFGDCFNNQRIDISKI